MWNPAAGNSDFFCKSTLSESQLISSPKLCTNLAGLNGSKSPRGNHSAAEKMDDQVYQAKMEDLKHQLLLLEEEAHPDLQRGLARLESQRTERKMLNATLFSIETEIANRQFQAELEAASKDFDDQEKSLRQQLVSDLEESLRRIEYERLGLDLMGDTAEQAEAPTTRKLRRRPHHPSGTFAVGDRRRKPSQYPFLLDDCDIRDDLKAIQKPKITIPKSRMMHPSFRLA